MSAQSKKKDAETAAMMKHFPNRYPDSTMRPGQGEGKSIRELARSFGTVPSTGKHYMLGMLGGVLADRLGFKSHKMELPEV